MASGSRFRRRTHVRIVWDVFDLVRDLLPQQPVVVRRKFMPAVHMEFNAPLDDEQKRQLRQAILKRFGRRLHVEIWDEEAER